MRAILTYHSIDPSDSVISVDEETLRRHANWFVEGNVPVVSVSDLLGMSEDEDGVALTFDDAFENFETTAWPILRERELPVTIFVVAGHVGGTNEWGGGSVAGIPTLPLLDWESLGRLSQEGVTIGSHTVRHPRLTGLDAPSLEKELGGSASRIEREIGSRPEGLAYPYGNVDSVVEEATATSYAWACTTELATLGSGTSRHLLPRLDAYYFRRAGQLETWGTPRFRTRLGLRRAARSVRAHVMGASA